MHSVLPAHLEAKRLAIAKTHNMLVVALMFSFAGALYLVATLPIGLTFALRIATVALVIIPLEAFAIYRVFKYDEKMCVRLGYMCPHCHKPLYEPRALTYLNGFCPKCGESVV